MSIKRLGTDFIVVLTENPKENNDPLGNIKFVTYHDYFVYRNKWVTCMYFAEYNNDN